MEPHLGIPVSTNGVNRTTFLNLREPLMPGQVDVDAIHDGHKSTRQNDIERAVGPFDWFRDRRPEIILWSLYSVLASVDHAPVTSHIAHVSIPAADDARHQLGSGERMPASRIALACASIAIARDAFAWRSSGVRF